MGIALATMKKHKIFDKAKTKASPNTGTKEGNTKSVQKSIIASDTGHSSTPIFLMALDAGHTI